MDENIFLNCTCVDQRNCKLWRFWHFPSEKSYSCFASKKKICWSFIQRLSLTTQKWMKQLNTKNINVFTCLKFWVIFPCRMLCKLIWFIFNSPYSLTLSFYLYHVQDHGSYKFVLENRKDVGLQRNISKMSAAYNMLWFNCPY